jgi:hypothetical protein
MACRCYVAGDRLDLGEPSELAGGQVEPVPISGIDDQ